MNKLSVRDLDVKGKRVLVRVDFNVPLDNSGRITDDTRIRAALPTIKWILDNGGRPILMSHLGRPKGKVVPELSLKPVAGTLQSLLGADVIMAPDCIGPEVEKMAAELEEGKCLLLENLRFHKEETDNDPEFAKKLASLGDVYVNDAFGSAHRAHASTEGVTHYFEKCAAGFLMEKEINYLGKVLENPERPFVSIIGGAKISGKIDVIENLLEKVDKLLIGGGMAFTFFRAKGIDVGASLVEEDKVDLAASILSKGKDKILLPSDCIAAERMEAGAVSKVVKIDEIPSGWGGYDIGPDSVESFSSVINNAKTIVWNGPMGVFEIKDFENGTAGIARAMASATERGGITVVGGGDTAAAVAKFGLSDKMSHVSTGGGASLEMMEGKVLPGVAALTDK